MQKTTGRCAPFRTAAFMGCLFALSVSAQTADTLLVPYVMNHRVGGSSPADLSFLQEAPAGRDGFVHIQDGHLVTDGGKRIRFWGVHLTDWSKGSVLLPRKKTLRCGRQRCRVLVST